MTLNVYNCILMLIMLLFSIFYFFKYINIKEGNTDAGTGAAAESNADTDDIGWKAYYKAYPDLKTNGVTEDVSSVLHHWIYYGQKEKARNWFNDTPGEDPIIKVRFRVTNPDEMLYSLIGDTAEKNNSILKKFTVLLYYQKIVEEKLNTLYNKYNGEDYISSEQLVKINRYLNQNIDLKTYTKEDMAKDIINITNNIAT